MWVHDNSPLPLPGTKRSIARLPVKEEGQRRVMRLTADLVAGTLSFVVQIVTIASDGGVSVVMSTAEGREGCRIPIDNLGAYHLHAASAHPVKLTLLE
jgi:hypothetical protein